MGILAMTMRSLILDRQAMVRRTVQIPFRFLLRWRSTSAYADGFSIILGVPWSLRDLLDVNLQFLSRTDLSGLDQLHVVFDNGDAREVEAFGTALASKWSVLPLIPHSHASVVGAITRHVNRSKFFASMNWITGLVACRTRYAILHDFDLYPTQYDYFQRTQGCLESGALFAGPETTQFGGLREHDNIIGTWALGIDLNWLQSRYAPVDCFHRVRKWQGRRLDLDAFSSIQLECSRDRRQVTSRALDYVHIRNLCSTYQRFTSGQPVNVEWRLHSLWYLRSVLGGEEQLRKLTDTMEGAQCSRICVDGIEVDFAGAHSTAAKVLRSEVSRMEEFTFGSVRPEVCEYLDAVDSFLGEFGRKS